MSADERLEKEETRVLSREENPRFNIKRSSDSFSSSSSAAFPSEVSKWGADEMLKTELDAARALADFAQLALLESRNHSDESGRKWRNKRRRSTKRVKSESQERDPGKNLESSKLKSLDLVKDQSIEGQQRHKKLCKNVPIKKVKHEPKSELPRLTHMCSMSYVPFDGGKQKLTEAEKEAKRLRRILANRESARQTIRRRQAIREELTRKAAELTLKNESMRREKELVMKEYQLLKDTNKHLEAQMARMRKAKMEEAPEEILSTHIKFPPESLSEKSKLLRCNKTAFPSFVWPSIIQSLNTGQAQPITNRPRIPFYVLPCHWFFPHPNHGNRLHPHPLDSRGLSDKQDDIYVANKRDARSLTNLENQSPSLPREVEACASNSPEANRTDNPPDASSIPRFLANGNIESLFLGTHPSEVIPTMLPLTSVKPTISVKCGNQLERDSTSKEDSVSSTNSQASRSRLENITELSGLRDYACKKVVDASEARKRRKEINKIKILSSRQLRLGC